MANMWKPNVKQMATPIRIQTRQETVINGMSDLTYNDINNSIQFCNWKGRGGTESTQSGALVIEDTAELTMWYNPDITNTCRIMTFNKSSANPVWNELVENLDSEDLTWLDEWPIIEEYYDIFEIINVENIEMRNQFMVLKVRRVVNA